LPASSVTFRVDAARRVRKVGARRRFIRVMTSTIGREAGFRGALVGIVVGGLSWIVISGLIVRDIVLWAPAVLTGAGLIWLAMWAHARRPERAITILGMTLLCVVVMCALYLQPVWDRIPNQLCVTTGKSAFLPSAVRIFLGLLAAAGAGLVARDLLLKR